MDRGDQSTNTEGVSYEEQRAENRRRLVATAVSEVVALIATRFSLDFTPE